MRLKLIDRIVWTTVWAASLYCVGGLFSGHFKEGLALFFGAIWGACNLFFLKNLLYQWLLMRKLDRKFFLLLLLKWPLLYAAGFFLLKNKHFSSIYLLAGFSLLFGVIILLGIVETLRKRI